MQRIRVLVNGARGKMGSHVVRAVKAQGDLDLVGATDLGDDLQASISSTHADVVIDFTEPGSALSNALAIIDSGSRPVIGTTGWAVDQIERVRSACERLRRGAVIAPNFAIGALLLMRFAAEASEHLPAVEIIELHHDQKADAPSGTALKTAEGIASRGKASSRRPPSERELIGGARGALGPGDVRIHSIRLPGLVAHEEVIFGGPGECLTIRHDSLSRECFMPGVLLAVRRVMGLQGLVYGLESLLISPAADRR